MKPMTCSNKNVNIFDINYPCYVSEIPNNSQRILYIPGEFEYKYLDEVRNYVLEGYKTENQIYLFDTILHSLWKKGVCNISYEKRLKTLHTLCTSQIANFSKVTDLPTLLIENPYEFNDYRESLLTNGIKKVRIMDVNGNYVFGESQNGEYLEADL